MLEIGRVCIKIAGRDAGMKCVIVDIDGDSYVIDGQTRRRKVNGLHLEPLTDKVDVKKGASHTDAVKALKGLGIDCKESKPRKAAERPRKVRKVKAPKVKKEVKAEPKEVKKEKPKEEKKAEEKPKAEEAKPEAKN
ncbi:MAG: hypothetical protein ACE5FT_03285 [Candidatus Nanoarchaeia archaeon]